MLRNFEYSGILLQRINIVDYKPDGQTIKKCLYSQGHSLVFTFVRADGVSADFISVCTQPFKIIKFNDDIIHHAYDHYVINFT